MSDGRHGKDEATSIVAWLQAKVERLTADMDRLERDLAERERLDQVTFSAGSLPAAAGDQTGPLPAVPQQRTRARHAARDRTHLKVVKVVLLAAFTGGLSAALRHAWAVNHTLVTAAAVTTAGGAIALTAAVVTTTATGSAPRAAAVAAPNPAGGADQATRLLSPPPARKPGLDARSSRKRVVPAVVVPAPVPPPVSARPSVPYSPPAPPPPLVLSATRIDLGVYLASQPGALTISDEGDTAVAWTATCSADVSLTPSQGFLAGGQQGMPVMVRINPVDGGSSGWCDFTPGNERLVISWAGAGSPSSAS